MLCNVACKAWNRKKKATLKKQAAYFFRHGTKQQTILKSLLLPIMLPVIKKLFWIN
jgi:hypothetical protein